MEKRNVELLAPAGSYESLVAAVRAGADAVYIGGRKFGARAYADNPEEDMLLKAIDFAHLYGCAVYLTVNTLLKDGEMEELYDYLAPYYEHGLDAVIVQDLGVLSYLRRQFPDLPIHASTQMTLTGPYGTRYLEALGATRIVTARELSLEEIREIHRQTPIEIESFIHGALCYCYSGQCLYSSLIGGRSGNRGRCAQPCRLPYDVLEDGRVLTRKGENYVLSPKDMCTIDLIPDLIEAGIYSFKIEGRMKRPEYTAGVVRIYRKYIDLYLKYGRKEYRVEEADRTELLDLYNRGGFSSGYYTQRNGRKLISLTRPGHFDERSKQAIKEKQRYEKLLAHLKKTYVETDQKEQEKLKLHGILSISKGLPSVFQVQYKEISVTADGPAAETPKNQPMTREQIEKQLRKTGNTPFVFDSLEIRMEDDIFLPIQGLNELRRTVLAEVEAAVLTASHRKSAAKLPLQEPVSQELPADYRPELHASIEEPAQLEPVLAVPEISTVYLDSSCVELTQLEPMAERCAKAGKECFFILPPIWRTEVLSQMEHHYQELEASSITGIVVKNLEAFFFFKEHGWKKPVILDHNMYSFNREAKKFWREQGIAYGTLPLELNYQELSALGCTDSELVVYGFLPMMVTAGCIQKTIRGCTKKPGLLYLKDRYKKIFPVKNQCRYCYNTILNTEPLSLLQNRAEILRLAPKSIRLAFTIEAPDEVTNILTAYTAAFVHGVPAAEPCKSFTRGHFKRGVE